MIVNFDWFFSLSKNEITFFENFENQLDFLIKPYISIYGKNRCLSRSSVAFFFFSSLSLLPFEWKLFSILSHTYVFFYYLFLLSFTLHEFASWRERKRNWKEGREHPPHYRLPSQIFWLRKYEFGNRRNFLFTFRWEERGTFIGNGERKERKES